MTNLCRPLISQELAEKLTSAESHSTQNGSFYLNGQYPCDLWVKVSDWTCHRKTTSTSSSPLWLWGDYFFFYPFQKEAAASASSPGAPGTGSGCVSGEPLNRITVTEAKCWPARIEDCLFAEDPEQKHGCYIVQGGLEGNQCCCRRGLPKAQVISQLLFQSPRLAFVESGQELLLRQFLPVGPSLRL